MVDTPTSAAEPAPTVLLGGWRLQRRIRDRRHGVSGRVVGELVVRRDGADLHWHERGTLHWDGATVPVWRDLRLRQDDAGWSVFFADGRPFHPWRPGAVVEHPCREDLYRGLITVSAAMLRTLWDVTGPAKDLRILTRCLRA
jgi:hypothetical protein